MEAAIKKLDGVHDATVSFMTQKLTLDADDTRFDGNSERGRQGVQKVEPDCTIVR